MSDIAKIIIQIGGSTSYQLVAEYADGTQKVLQGSFSSQDAAAERAREIADGDDSIDIVGVSADEGGYDMWVVDEWLFESAHSDVRADSTDEELAALVSTYMADAESERIQLVGDALTYLEQVRQEMQEAE